MCLFPRLRKNPKYLPNGKNKGNVPIPTDPRVMWVPIGCGNCIECRRKKTRDWAIRLKEEVRQNNVATFVTLTFSNESITELYQDKAISNLTGYDLDNAAAKLAVRRMCERWRKHTGKSVRHWLITELGHNGTENIHLHGIIWSKDKEFINKTWKYGWVYHGKYVSERTVNYCMKYVTKIDVEHRGYQQKILTSAGMGDQYHKTMKSLANQYKGKDTQETYQDNKGIITSLPMYYRNKIYSDQERENLWIDKLDQEIRYIMGTKIDTATETGKLQYKKLLKEAQDLNRRLGYGNGNHKWTLANYELERREMLQKKRAQTNQGEEINSRKKKTARREQQTLGTNSIEEVGNLMVPIEAPSGTTTPQLVAGVLPASADRSTLGAPPKDEEINIAAFLKGSKEKKW